MTEADSQLSQLVEQRMRALDLTVTEAARISGLRREQLYRLKRARRVRAGTLAGLERLGIPRDQLEAAAGYDAGYGSPAGLSADVHRVALKLERLDEYDLQDVEHDVDRRLRRARR